MFAQSNQDYPTKGWTWNLAVLRTSTAVLLSCTKLWRSGQVGAVTESLLLALAD